MRYGLAKVAALMPAAPVAAGAEIVVTPGFDYTNVVIRVDGAPEAEVSVTDSANVEIAPNGVLAPVSAYAYDVWRGGVSIASGAFATGHDETAAECEWTISPVPWKDRLWVRDTAKVLRGFCGGLTPLVEFERWS